MFSSYGLRGAVAVLTGVGAGTGAAGLSVSLASLGATVRAAELAERVGLLITAGPLLSSLFLRFLDGSLSSLSDVSYMDIKLR